MREFEKWNKEQHHFVLKRETWRAAIQMILEDIALADKLGFEPVDILIQIEKKLREELEDEGNQ